MPQTPQIRPIRPAEFDAFLDVTTGAFGAPHDPAERALDREVLALDRTLAAFADDDGSSDGSGGGELVGATAVFDFELTVPGATLPAAGVTAVGVLATHRRRGILTALMHEQLAGVAARGQPLAVLFASEPGIYGRYGYGAAASAYSLVLPRAAARLLGPPEEGRCRLAAPSDVRPELEAVYDAGRHDRPGYYARPDAHWRMRIFDPESRRQGRAPLQAVLHIDGGGAPDGYVLYATSAAWRDSMPDGEVAVREIVANGPAAYAALWRYLLALDLMARVTVEVALDDPILAMLADPRAARPRHADNLWVRLVDLRAALVGRAYAAPVDVVLEVDDPLLAANADRWRLTADGSGARCERVKDRPDLGLGVDALGAAYLGGVSLATLAAAGRVRELRPGALAPAATAFGWPRAPYCPQVF